MNSNKMVIGFVAGCFVIVVLFAYIFLVDAKKPGTYDDFATCISNSGAKFYGAYWCPHCQKQKADFGKSAAKLPYVECEISPSDKKTAQDRVDEALASGQLVEGQDPSEIGIYTRSEACVVNKIESYPTWIFADGSRTTGEKSFAELSRLTGCIAPAGSEEPPAPTTETTTSVAQ